MYRSWHIYIPVRPKAVQSVRGAHGHFYVDPKVRKWKASITPYIDKACEGKPPSKMPIRVLYMRYVYKLPQSAPKHLVEFVRAGGRVPYLTSDLTDNISKGLIDVCKGRVFEDDSQIWDICNSTKQYGIDDHIELGFETTPDVTLVNGRTGDSLEYPDKVLYDSETLI